MNTFTPSQEQWETQQKQIADLLEQNKTLMKAVPQAQLAREIQKGRKFGQKVKISLYRSEFDSEARLIVKWELIKNDSFINSEGKAIANQVMRLTLAESKEVEDKIKVLNKTISVTTSDMEKKAKLEKEREALIASKYAEMSYHDFALRDVVEHDVVDVKGTKVMNGETIFIFDWKGQEQEIHGDYIN